MNKIDKIFNLQRQIFYFLLQNETDMQKTTPKKSSTSWAAIALDKIDEFEKDFKEWIKEEEVINE